jgi:hypothetical protein
LKSVPKRSLTTSMSCESGTGCSRSAPLPTSAGPSSFRASPSLSAMDPSLIFCSR